MRHIRQTKRELILRFSDFGHHGISRLLKLLSQFGKLCLAIGIWLGFQQDPVISMLLVIFGSLLAVIGQFMPQLYPEVATCIFNKSLNKLTVIHEMPAGQTYQRQRYRNVIHYQLSDLKRIEVYRTRSGLFRYAYSIMIELESLQSKSTEPVLIRLDGLHDQVIIQRGRTSAKLLTKEISYQFGRRIKVEWKYIDIPTEMNWNSLGRRIIAKNSMRRLPQLDMRQLAKEVKQFIGSP